MDTTPLPTPDTHWRKWLFIGGVMLLCIVLFWFSIALFSGKKAGGSVEGFDPKTTEVVLWTVDMSPALFEGLQKGFNDFVGRTDMKLIVHNFGSWKDYLDMVPRAIASGNSPDVFLVPNHGGYRHLDGYIEALGEGIVDIASIENRFHPLFLDELRVEEKTRVDDVDKVLIGIRGIPIGFEPLGMYYNRSLLAGTPTYWDEIPKNLKDIAPPPVQDTETPDARDGYTVVEDATAADTHVPVYAPAFSLGYGRATPVSTDIIAFLIGQKKGEQFLSYTQFNSIESRSIIEEYVKIGTSNFEQFRTELDQSLTMADLFVRGKVATLVGYPSTLTEIDGAIRRASRDDVDIGDFKREMRWTSVPQITEDSKKQVNLARYFYFALAKNGKNKDEESADNDPTFRFFQYITTESAQKILFQHSPLMLPATLELLDSQMDTVIRPNAKDFQMRVKDWYKPLQKFLPYDMGLPYAMKYILPKALDEPQTDGTLVAIRVTDFLGCQIMHLTRPETYSRPCECVRDVGAQGNYWPLCGRDN